MLHVHMCIRVYKTLFNKIKSIVNDDKEAESEYDADDEESTDEEEESDESAFFKKKWNIALNLKQT